MMSRNCCGIKGGARFNICVILLEVGCDNNGCSRSRVVV
jgi:hypothetical protein